MAIREFLWLHGMHERPPKLPHVVLEAVKNTNDYDGFWTEDPFLRHTWHGPLPPEHDDPVLGDDMQAMDDEEFNGRARNLGPGYYVQHPRHFRCLRSTTLYLMDESDNVLKIQFSVAYLPNTTALTPIGIRVNWSMWDTGTNSIWNDDGEFLNAEEIEPLLTNPCTKFQFHTIKMKSIISNKTKKMSKGGTTMTWSVAEEFGELIMQRISALCRCAPLHYPALPIF